MTQFFNCDKCGTLVGYAHTGEGIRYLANWSHQYENGARYRRGPHAETCAYQKAVRDDMLAREAAHAKLVRGVEIMRRWTMVYGDDFRTWATKDPEAAGAHFAAQCKRLAL